MFAHGATWDWNPKEGPEAYAEQYLLDPVKARRDYEALPPADVQAAMQDGSAIERLYDPGLRDPILPDGGFAEWFVGDPLCEYYLHGDLSRTRDATGLALSHFDVERGVVVVDMIIRMVPTPDHPLSFERVVLIALALVSRGFRLAKVTFDGWQSYSLIERLTAARIESDVYSVDRTTEGYDTFFNLLLTRRVLYPKHEILFREIKALKLYDGRKYDHPPGGSKDVADAVAASVACCVKARIGTLNQINLEAIVHEEHAVQIASQVSESGATTYAVASSMVAPEERARPRSVRIDMAEDSMLMLWGWYGASDDRHYLDELLVWDRFDYSAIPSFEELLAALMRLLPVRAFSLGASVPVEVLTIVQATGRHVATPLSARVPGQHTFVAQTGNVDAKMVRMCLEHVRRQQVSVPRILPLFTDIRYATDDSLGSRPYLCAFAAWWDFAMREQHFGRGGKTLPAPQLGRGGAAINAASRRPGSAVPSGADDLAGVRAMAYNGHRPAEVYGQQSEASAGRRTLPRARKI